MTLLTETFSGIVQRITYHNPDNGWSVLRVQSFISHEKQETVTVHQTKVFAGATMEFKGAWTTHPKFGRQFKAVEALEKKPATAGALEKYLGSGLIKGVGPKTAKKIVRHFGKETLDIFEHKIDLLTEVPGIAHKKLEMIGSAWQEHRSIRDVMMFLQHHGISTLFAVRIYKEYGDNAIQIVSQDPYRLVHDFYGIGFFSADKVALSIGLARDSDQRIIAAIKHVLAGSREEGHCYLTLSQLEQQVPQLLEMVMGTPLPHYLDVMEKEHHLRVRLIPDENRLEERCYYSNTLYHDEAAVASCIHTLAGKMQIEQQRIKTWTDKYCQRHSIQLSDEQADSVRGVASHGFSILTGGPGCGKTTTTLVIVRLLEAMGRKVLLAAPTGRAAQRMSEVIGREAKTIHRLLEWQRGFFQKNAEQPLETDFLIIDECSMLDISLSAGLLSAVPAGCQVLFIGDADQLPSVGAGNVLGDMLMSGMIPCFHLTKVFRQAEKSMIIHHAHHINKGDTPRIDSPFKTPEIWKDETDCLFIDADEATQEQIQFVRRIKCFFDQQETSSINQDVNDQNLFEFRTEEAITSSYEKDLVIPPKFQHVDLQTVYNAANSIEELKSVLQKVHPWSSLHYGFSALDVVEKLYLEWIPKYYGGNCEIQVLSPMTRGSLGTTNINAMLQKKANPEQPGKRQLQFGEKIFREGDRVIHRRNNYDLNVFNGDIGRIVSIDTEDMTCVVSFSPDNREIIYQKEDMAQLDLAYAITIHKSQGSEFEAVIIPVLTQHFKMLYRNLIYTGLTRGRKLAVFVGTRKALAMAVRQQDTSKRQTALKHLLINTFTGPDRT
ncbi:MAG: AAA family ATPase [Desulfobulbaceae bacterium]|uniref:AAA family ATPase n=1 Tax=Candidatus Desulfobia pelagia TaxID=2841692 RepID=A0A8J6NCY1_9BACT|nr:AAA family ATPase [Candidatus Desulfobia pelagia]